MRSPRPSSSSVAPGHGHVGMGVDRRSTTPWIHVCTWAATKYGSRSSSSSRRGSSSRRRRAAGTRRARRRTIRPPGRSLLENSTRYWPGWSSGELHVGLDRGRGTTIERIGDAEPASRRAPRGSSSSSTRPTRAADRGGRRSGGRRRWRTRRPRGRPRAARCSRCRRASPSGSPPPRAGPGAADRPPPERSSAVAPEPPQHSCAEPTPGPVSPGTYPDATLLELESRTGSLGITEPRRRTGRLSES